MAEVHSVKDALDLFEQVLRIFTMGFTLPWGLMRFCQFLQREKHRDTRTPERTD